MKRKEYMNLLHGRFIDIQFHEQAIFRKGTKKKKVYLINVDDMAM